MTPALDDRQRKDLESAIGRLRVRLEDDLAAQLEGTHGIYEDRPPDPEAALKLDPSALQDRRELVDVVTYLQATGELRANAVRRLVREASFTHLNRLVAIRIAEALELLPPSLAAGRESAGFRDVLEVAPLLRDDPTGGYWTYLRLCGDELAADAPVLFDPRNPLLALAPSPKALDAVVEVLSDGDLADIWPAPDALGWTYQFFNTGEERRQMRAESGAPRTSRELAVRNQFFTPRYVVDFLVQNTLGRRLMEADPTSPLLADLPLLIDPPTEPGAPLALEDVRLLDPAAGSGHFLLGSYDVLERAWELAGVPPAEAAARILPCLWGIDIDPRCAQVASAALILRARRHCRHGDLPRPNVITARALPDVGEVWDRVLDDLPPDRRALVERMRDALALAPVLGPLLKVEEELAEAIHRIVPAADANLPLFGQTALAGATADAFAQIEAEVLGALQRIADEATSTPAERLLAAEAGDAIRFVEALRQRYDAVLMNPPFGEPVAGTKGVLRRVYGNLQGTTDLLAAFVDRGVQILDAHGYVGAITSRVGFFLGSFESWRRNVLYRNRLVAVADLGEGVMDQAMVEAAAYVLAGSAPSGYQTTPVIRALTAGDRAQVVAAAVANARMGYADDSLFRVRPEDMHVLPAAPLVYWVDPGIIQQLMRHRSFEPNFGTVCVGLQTSDDFRFVRAWWEVDARKLTRPPKQAGGLSVHDQLARGHARWAPIVKAGASQPWYSPITLVVDWEGDGERLRNFRDKDGRLLSRPQNTQYYFKPGFSWTRRAPRLVPYVVPSGCIPSVSRYQAFPSGDPYEAVGLVASNVASSYCRFYGEKFLWPNFLVENVRSSPIAAIDSALARDIEATVKDGVSKRRSLYTGIEPFREFESFKPTIGTDDWSYRSLLGMDLDVRVASAYGIDQDQARILDRDLREALGVLGHVTDDSTDRPRSVNAGSVEQLISYCVGAAFGRWDIRIGRDDSRAPSMGDPFDVLPATPPGMLVDADGNPAGAAPSGYPLDLPPGRIMVDEPGHEWDIETRVSAALDAMFDELPTVLPSTDQSLDAKSVRDYLRRRFFQDHLATYSEGGRKAPIYWQLSVPSRAWSVWVYAPALTRDTLFAVQGEAARRERLAEETIRRLHAERAGGGAGRSVKAVDTALAAEQDLAEELRAFREEAERVAGLGWTPDLDDGIILCAAPLAGLFPAWPDAAAAREELRRGKYPWAGVSRWAAEL